MSKAKFMGIKWKITEYFDGLSTKVFRREDLIEIFKEWREQWGFGKTIGHERLIGLLLKHSFLRNWRVESKEGKEVYRYFWRIEPTLFEIALSFGSDTYLSHGTSAFLHGLIKPAPFKIYVNKEKSHKIQLAGQLIQKNVDQAFNGKQRSSGQIFPYGKYEIVILNGKITENLGVESVQDKDNSDLLLRATSLERTLIDIVVRPLYAGGVGQVLEAFRAAKPKLSSSQLKVTLDKLNHQYPYHQAIGFYLERAGYGEDQWKRFLDVSQPLKFYLDYEMQNSSYDPK